MPYLLKFDFFIYFNYLLMSNQIELADNIWNKFNEEQNQDNKNKTMWYLLESNGKTKTGEIIVPKNNLTSWNYVMLEPYHWPYHNEWTHHAMVLINYLTKTNPAKLKCIINNRGGYHLNGNGYPTGMTALHWSVNNGSPIVVEALLNIDCIDINSRDYHGRTPLYISLIGNTHMKIFCYLIRAGADFSIADNKGKTPLSNIILWWEKEWLALMIMDYLKDYDYDMVEDTGYNLLRWAKECKRYNVVKKIEEKMK